MKPSVDNSMKTIRPQPRFRAAPSAAPTASSHAVPQIQLPAGRGPEIVWGSVALRPQISRKNRDLPKSPKKRKSIYTISPESSSPRHYLYSVLLGSNLRTDKSAPAACDFCCAPHTIKFSITHPHELHGYLVLTWPMIGTKALPKIGERAVT